MSMFLDWANGQKLIAAFNNRFEVCVYICREGDNVRLALYRDRTKTEGVNVLLRDNSVNGVLVELDILSVTKIKDNEKAPVTALVLPVAEP